MPDKPWKVFERKLAAYFGGQRVIPADTRTAGDVLHDTLYIEAKKRKRHSCVALWDDTDAKAKKEGKIPVVCLSENGRPHFWILVRSDHLTEL